MTRPHARPSLPIAALAVTLVAWVCAAEPPSEPATKPAAKASGAPAPAVARDRAIALYDEGKYPEARAAFETLDKDGKADGAVLYRLSYCLGVAGDRGAQSGVLARAVAELEKETAGVGGLESWFYLANAYRNAGRAADASRVAADATAKIETGTWPLPARALDQFRLGKLYSDQARVDDAAAWFLKAVAAFDKEPGSYPAYVQWSRRFLGDLAAARMDWAGADREYAALVKAAKPQSQDWSKLAVIRVRLGRWNEAAEAWREAERANPASGDDARYARHLALQAAELGALPSFARDGRGWDLLSKDELEEEMKNGAKVAGDAAQAIASGRAAADPELRADVARKLAEARPYFLAAAIEYAARGLPIRETAFSGGYAPLVFHPEQWKVPE